MRKLEYIVEPESLLLSWQDPIGRNRYIVGQLTREGGAVCFRYLKGDDLNAAKAKGFKGYIAFPHFDSEYRLGVMESFMSRLPPRSRKDFGKFLGYWHIDSKLKASISDFALLGYTGAALPRDGFRFLPVFAAADRLEFVVEVARHRYQGSACEIGDEVRFVVEPENSFDCEAVAVAGQDGCKLGHIMHGMNHQFIEWLAAGLLSGEIVRINGSTERPVVLVCVEFNRHADQLTRLG